MHYGAIGIRKILSVGTSKIPIIYLINNSHHLNFLKISFFSHFLPSFLLHKHPFNINFPQNTFYLFPLKRNPSRLTHNRRQPNPSPNHLHVRRHLPSPPTGIRLGPHQRRLRNLHPNTGHYRQGRNPFVCQVVGKSASDC